MNIIALISELKWYHDVATTCATDLTPTPQATKERTKERERERAKRCEGKASPSPTAALCVVVQPLQEKLHIMMLLVRLHGCIIYSTNVFFSHPFTISCTVPMLGSPKEKVELLVIV